nr:MAG TPA: hypothetical protein [Caudoviricetes sp.]
MKILVLRILDMIIQKCPPINFLLILKNSLIFLEFMLKQYMIKRELKRDSPI